MNHPENGGDAPFRYISATEVVRRIDLGLAVDAVRAAFAARSIDPDENPARLALGEGRVLVMASRRATGGDAVVKALRVRAHGDRPDADRAAIDGLVLWLGGDDQPVLAADAGALTALRTAAVVAVATDLLADAGAHRLALLGAGRQAIEQVRAVALTRPLERITVWNRTHRRGRMLAERLARVLPDVTIDQAETPAAAVREADVICCATAGTEPLFDAAAPPAHAHVNAIGSYRPDMRELSGELLARAELVAVDDAAACQTEAGEIIDAVRSGVLTSDGLHELSTLLSDPPERHGITVFKSVGVALADLAVMSALAAALSSEVTPRSPRSPAS